MGQGRQALDIVARDDAQMLGLGEKPAAALMRMLDVEVTLLHNEGPSLIDNPPDHAIPPLLWQRKSPGGIRVP